MLVDKYKPAKLSDIVAREVLLAPIINKISEAHEIPHLLFVGPPGQGKTLTANCIRFELFGAEPPAGSWYDLNASSDNGVDAMREKIPNWAKLAPPKIDGQRRHRVIFLDEFDYATKNAQAILRRVMEDYSKTCRFIIACNFGAQIIEAIYSRCQVFEFKPIKPAPIAAYLAWVSEQEGRTPDRTAIKQIAEQCGGDMRKALNMLEAHLNGGSIATRDPRPIFSRSFGDIAKLSYEYDATLIFTWMHDELLKQHAAGKSIGKSIVALSEYEARAAHAVLKACHVQACWLVIKGQLANA